jgi:hypothetical protein
MCNNHLKFNLLLEFLSLKALGSDFQIDCMQKLLENILSLDNSAEAREPFQIYWRFSSGD